MLFYDQTNGRKQYVGTGKGNGEVEKGSVVFKITGDGKELYNSGIMRGGETTRAISLPVEGIKILEEAVAKGHTFEFPVYWGVDLASEHERFLVEEHFKRPVILTDYPKEIKAFYMKMNEDNKTVAAMDCLVPGIGEIIGGSQREDDYEKLLGRMKELGLAEEDYGFYLDLRKYGSTHHAGFGLGFERCVMYLTGMGNIRDVIPFPRTVNNCEL